MALNTYPPKPDWLTDKKIEKYRSILRNCPDPLTDEDISHWQYDGYNDFDRLEARRAYDIVSQFGLLEEQEGKS